jgi:hypothetical protein
MTTNATPARRTAPRRATPPPSDRRLAQSHQALLAASGIDPAVAGERGCWTAVNPKELADLGFAGTQQLAPALVLPVWDVHGRVAFSQIRPNTPRLNGDGDPIKYETPAGARMVLDAHPRIRAMLRDPQIPLYITEGIKKADSAISRGLCSVALLGVTNWRGTNASGGKTALACWQNIALNGRPVFVVFDSDSGTNNKVLLQAITLGEFLESKGAEAQIVALPPGPNGAKVGLDDYFAAGGSAAALPALAEPLKQVAKRLRTATRNATTADYVDALRQLGYTFRLNDCDDTVEVNSKPITDPLAAKICSQMQDSGFDRIKRMENAYLAEALDHRYNPIKDYLSGLVWDGKDYIAALAAYITCPDPPITYDDGTTLPLHHLYLTRWLIGAVAKVFEQAQNAMLVMVGPQDTGKSALARWLCGGLPDYFLEAPINPDDKDSSVRLMRYFVWEVGELGATTRRADVEALKDFITKKTVVVRKSYGRFDTRKPATAALVGTVNEGTGFLVDESGNRRFLVFRAKAIDWSYSTNLDPNQLWAQAVALYRAGESGRLQPGEALVRDRQNRQFDVADLLDGWIAKYFDLDADPSETMTPADIADHLARHEIRLSGNTLAQAQAIGRAMRRRNVLWRPTRAGRRYYGIAPRAFAASTDDDDDPDPAVKLPPTSPATSPSTSPSFRASGSRREVGEVGEVKNPIEQQGDHGTQQIMTPHEKTTPTTPPTSPPLQKAVNTVKLNGEVGGEVGDEAMARDAKILERVATFLAQKRYNTARGVARHLATEAARAQAQALIAAAWAERPGVVGEVDLPLPDPADVIARLQARQAKNGDGP